MGMFSDWFADYAFENDYPHGLPTDEWITKSGAPIKLTDMTDSHLKNCMKMVGEDDKWYYAFEKELESRNAI